jgi:tRNA(His) 5'-end guanylyltransferase
MNDSLGDRMKAYEMAEAGRKLLPLIPAVARIDGRSFSSFTRGLARPYDQRLADLMMETVKYLVQETNANCGYTQSDEISLVWYSPTTETEILFNGRVQKMESVLAGMTSSYFLYHCPKFLPAEYAAKLPHFDARVWNVPTKEEAANCFLWREWDATKNSISMAAQHYYSHNELMGKNGSDKQEMLFQKGVNWNNYPDFFKRGSYIQRRKTLRKFDASELEALPPKHEARKNPDLVVERTDYVRVNMPPLGKVTNRVGVIFDGEEPVVSSEQATA